MKRKSVAMLLSMALSASMLLGLAAPIKGGVSAAETEVTDAQCTTTGTAEPKSDECVPDANQYKYQKDELAAFCHFGPNTFSGEEWGWVNGKDIYAGKTADEIFPLRKETNVKQLVDELWNAGFRKLIITAKHHNGFCIWQSDYTDYDMGSVKNYKNGQGDILAEISEECTKKGMDMGLYLSPWDFHEPSFGFRNPGEESKPLSEDDYNIYYNNQLEEILSNEKYGNAGHFVEVWMDGANNSPYKQVYDFERWFNTIQKYEGKEAKQEADCLLFGAGVHTTVRWIGNEDGLADENTWSKSIRQKNPQTGADELLHSQNQKPNGDPNGKFSVGFENGNQWTVPEADARITSGWFWGENKKDPKSLKQLSEMYFNSVGHNATLLLNVPLNTDSEVDAPTLKRVQEFGQNIQQTFKTNLAKAEDATVVASNVRGNDAAFKPGQAIDGDDATYWTTDEGNKSGSLTVKWKSPKNFDVVSIEEAIQKGQRINKYKVEYKATDDAQWQELKSGVTIGAKRLVRTNPVSATQVRITVETPEGKVPMLSEIGVYKASKAFQLSGTAPQGMTVTSVGDTEKFAFSSGWNPETGVQYINGKNTYSNQANASFTYKFTGTKVYLMGTVDPNHGEADVYIDDMAKPVQTISTTKSPRETGVVIFESDNLSNQEHTLKLVAKTNKAIGVEAAYVINNGEKGMLEIENKAYTMNEDSDLAVKIKRVGGSKGKITALLSPNPGTAIQKHFDTGLITTVTFEEGETEKTIEKAAHANRVTEVEGDKDFTLELTSNEPVVGLGSEARVTIKDLDGYRGELEALVEECEGRTPNGYESGWDAFNTALEEALDVLADEEAPAENVLAAYEKLKEAKEGLVARTAVYTKESPFIFPAKTETVELLEAELATELINSDDTDSDPNWDLALGHADWASGSGEKNIVNCLAQKDLVKYAYRADVAGEYEVTLTYGSGSTVNKLKWTEEGNKIEEGQTDALAQGNGKTVKFTLKVKEAGEGTLVLTAPDSGKGPQLDKFEIKLKTPANPSDLTTLNTKIEEVETLLASEEKDQYSKELLTDLRKILRKAKNLTTADAQDDIAKAVKEIEDKLAEIKTTFTITASAGENGKIAPEGEVKVYNRSSRTFAITPDTGYHVEKLIVDGREVDPQTSYTFENVEGNHEISVEFAKDADKPVDPNPEKPVDPDPEKPVNPSPEKPVNPDPEKPVKPNGGNGNQASGNNTGAVQTGDAANVLFPIAGVAVAAILAGVVVFRRKKMK